MFPTSTMCAINKIPVGTLPLHFGPFHVRSISSSEMASGQNSRREGFGGSCALWPLVRVIFQHSTLTAFEAVAAYKCFKSDGNQCDQNTFTNVKALNGSL